MTLPGFEVTLVNDDGPSATVAVAGEVDLATAPQLAAVLEQVDSANAKAVHVDMGAVTFLDSSGISVLVQSQKRLAEGGGGLVLHRSSEQILRVLEISGLGSFFDLSDQPPA